MRIILASKSPRRKELLSLITKNFEVIVSDADENVDEEIAPAEKVKQIAKKKARAVFTDVKEDCIVIGSDTIVVLEDVVLGKPKNTANAVEMLQAISDRTHEVMTGICVIARKNGEISEYTDCDIAKVHVKKLSDEEINAWLATGNAWDKAGAYAIQQEFAVHIDKINGSYATVMGLPVHLVYDAIKTLGGNN